MMHMYTPEETDLGKTTIRLVTDDFEKPTIASEHILFKLGREELELSGV